MGCVFVGLRSDLPTACRLHAGPVYAFVEEDLLFPLETAPSKLHAQGVLEKPDTAEVFFLHLFYETI